MRSSQKLHAYLTLTAKTGVFEMEIGMHFQQQFYLNKGIISEMDCLTKGLYCTWFPVTTNFYIFANDIVFFSCFYFQNTIIFRIISLQYSQREKNDTTHYLGQGQTHGLCKIPHL